jgi:hypothetical protein
MLCRGSYPVEGHRMPGEGAVVCQRTKTLKTPFSRLALSLRAMGGTGGLTAAAPSTAGAGGASGTPAALAATATARRAGGGTDLSWAARGGARRRLATAAPAEGGAHGEAVSGRVSTLCHTGVVGGCLLAAVCWMRGHAMPTGGGA